MNEENPKPTEVEVALYEVVSGVQHALYNEPALAMYLPEGLADRVRGAMARFQSRYQVVSR
jgi:hypothetical protein